MLGDVHSMSLLAVEDGKASWVWPDPLPLASVLWHIALSAGELLTSSELSLVKKCDGRNCGWLFVDSSKNHSRRWCSMDVCGARAKMRTLYARTKASAGNSRRPLCSDGSAG